MDTGTQTKDTGRKAPAAQAAMETRRDFGSRAGAKADEAAQAVGEKMESAAKTIGQQSQRAGWILRDAAATVTEGLKESATYLQGEEISGVFEDIETIIRRYPVQTLVIGIGIGFLLSRGRTRL